MIIPEETQSSKYKFAKQKITSLPRGLPIAWGEVVPPKPGRSKWRFLVTDCPFCGQRHIHGWPSPDDTEQKGGVGTTRVSHCTSIRIGRREINTGGGQYCLLPSQLKPRQRKVEDES